MRYDTAIIGAGANGLAAAVVLARAGYRVVLIERAPVCGGRMVTRQFHPGFRASIFSDTLGAIPAEVATALALDEGLCRTTAIPPRLDGLHRLAWARALAEAQKPRHWLDRLIPPRHAALSAPWPGSDLATASLADILPDSLAGQPALMAATLAGRALDPQLAGSALAALTLPRAEPVSGGLGRLGAAFHAAALAAGVEIRLDLEASEVLTASARWSPNGRRVTGLMLADGSEVAADAVISTLDLKRSLLSLFPWSTLPRPCLAQAAAFRPGGGTARLLLALKRPCLEQPLFLPSPDGENGARAAFRRGAMPEHPPLLADPVSSRDASLAPPGAAVVTVTLGCIPARLFDGAWTHEKRLTLAARALRRLSAACPGLTDALAAIDITVPPDIEEALGLSDGDLDGGQLAPDQMLGLRPGPRTSITGFYLGGPSAAAGPLGTGAAGYTAATALLADRARGRR